MWIFRNKNNYLAATNMEPIKGKEIFSTAIGSYVMPLPEDEFPEITWENSPIQIKSFILNGETIEKILQEVTLPQINTPSERPVYANGIATPDWEQIRINAAISALNALRSNPSHCGKSYESEASHAVKYADALINELKKK